MSKWLSYKFLEGKTFSWQFLKLKDNNYLSPKFPDTSILRYETDQIPIGDKNTSLDGLYTLQGV